MSAETEIYARLSTTAGVTNLCALRMYPMNAPETCDAPYVVFGLVSATPNPSASGQVGFSNCTYSVECTDVSHAGASALGAAVKTALEGLTGTTIKWCSHRGDNEEWTDAADSEDVGLYTIIQEWYLRTV
jgi:hypothetical protein